MGPHLLHIYSPLSPPPSTRPFSFIISPSSIDCCSQTGSCWKSSNSGLPLSHPAVNNEIKVTNCQEVGKLRLPLMCVCAKVSVWACMAQTHTWDSVYDSSNVPEVLQCPQCFLWAQQRPLNLQTADTEWPWSPSLQAYTFLTSESCYACITLWLF